MNGYALIAHAMWAGVVLCAIYTAAQLFDRWLGAKDPSMPDEEPIPDDLLSIAMAEDAEWAQQSVIKVIRQRHALYGDWNKVRAAMGIGRVDRL